MYLYSSDRYCIKIMLTKSDAENLIFNQPSKHIRKCIIFAILKVALSKSKFLLSKGSVSARLFECSKGNFILEFTQNKAEQQLYCYCCAHLSNVADNLRILSENRAKVSKLYYKDGRYFLLSEKRINARLFSKSDYIEDVLREYASLISENATKEIARLL